ncbi:hypothetical protein HDU85_004363 [Gaertneriomyces sp. JEL0708]|nr:hypothetical protein HDU85_004363 [Gaertneriomyces sp. JEL0708]
MADLPLAMFTNRDLIKMKEEATTSNSTWLQEFRRWFFSGYPALKVDSQTHEASFKYIFATTFVPCSVPIMLAFWVFVLPYVLYRVDVFSTFDWSSIAGFAWFFLPLALIPVLISSELRFRIRMNQEVTEKALLMYELNEYRAASVACLPEYTADPKLDTSTLTVCIE